MQSKVFFCIFRLKIIQLYTAAEHRFRFLSIQTDFSECACELLSYNKALAMMTRGTRVIRGCNMRNESARKASGT